MILGIAPGAMGFQARTQASISHRVRAERRCAEIISPATAGARLAALFQIPFSGTRAACERANVFLTVSRATENATSFAVRRFGTIGARRIEKCRFAIHWRKNLHFLAERKVPKLLCYFLSYKKVKAVSLFREA